MKIYLIRHAQSVTEMVNPKKPLSDIGITQVQKLSEFLKHLNISVKHILHSTKERAKQTAEIVSTAIYSIDGLKEVSYLNPNDSVENMVLEIQNMSEDICIVGHLPYMSHLLSSLIVESESKNIVDFGEATCVCLESIDNERYIIKWCVSPDML